MIGKLESVNLRKVWPKEDRHFTTWLFDNLDMLGEIPLEMAIRELADSGTPTVVALPESETAKRYQRIALKIAGKLSVKKKDFSNAFPNIVVENS